MKFYEYRFADGHVVGSSRPLLKREVKEKEKLYGCLMSQCTVIR